MYSALVGATDASGKSIFAGREATGFTNAEEEAVKAVETIPFLVESRIRELGGKFVNVDLWAVRHFFYLMFGNMTYEINEFVHI